MRLLDAITIACLLALSVQPSAVLAQQDDAAACGRKAVDAGVGSGQVNDYVTRCVAELRAVRAQDRDGSTGRERPTRGAADEEKSGDKGKTKAEGLEKSKDKASAMAKDAEQSKDKMKSKDKEQSKDKGKKK